MATSTTTITTTTSTTTNDNDTNGVASSLAKMVLANANANEGRMIDGFDVNQVVRLMVQAMRELGYLESAAKLEQEAGTPLQHQSLKDFQQAVLAGLWDRVLQLAPSLQLVSSDRKTVLLLLLLVVRIVVVVVVVRVVVGAFRNFKPLPILIVRYCALCCCAHPLLPAQDVEFLIWEQRYLELLDAGDTTAALACLRTTLTPLSSDANNARLHKLARYAMILLPTTIVVLRLISHQLSNISLLMCPTSSDLRARANWPGGVESREQLISRLRGRFICKFCVQHGSLMSCLCLCVCL
jgi:hypothetical protein